jgi:hypothetical protein
MNPFLIRLSVIFAWLAVFGQGAFAAVTFTVAPSAVSNTYAGSISLHIGGLTNTETVVIQKFLDLNTNGVLDGNDWLVQQFTLQDGANFVIGGVTNFNVPGDLNPATGAITAALNFQNGDFVQNIIGKYLYKLSSPGGHFAPLTNSFSVTNFPFLQKFTGNVVSNGTSTTVSNAVVLLFPPPRPGHNGPGGNPLAGVVANNAGSYTVQMPPGTYMPMAFRSNYVVDYTASPLLTLAASQTLTTNLTLTGATASITGKIVDANDASIGLPGVFLPAMSTNGLIAIVFTDTNGDFTARVTASQWSLGSSDSGLIVHGYVGWNNDINVNSGATNVTLAYPKANALFYGSVKDNLGNPLVGIDVESYDSNSNLYSMDGYTDTNGNYFVGALGGLSNDSWQVDISDKSPTNYIFSQPDFDSNGGTNISVNTAVLINFTALLATNYIAGNVKDSSNNPIAGVGVDANATINGTNYQAYADTDTTGNYSLNVATGTWNISINCNGGSDSLDNILGSGKYACPNNQSATISGNNATNNFFVQLCGGISIGTTSLPDGEVNVPYDQFLQASSCNGSFTWTKTAGSVPGLSLLGTGELTGTPNTNGVFTFTAQVTDQNNLTTNEQLSVTINPAVPLQINTTSPLPDGLNGTSYSQQLEASGGAPPYSWSLAPGSSSLPLNLSLTSSNGLIAGNLAASGAFNFTVQVTDQQSTTVTQSYSLTITNPPLVITTTSLPVAVVTVPYANQLQATGGQPPYTWTLGPGSDLLPFGLDLSTNGLVSGVPASSGISNLVFRATDASAEFADQPISLIVGVKPSISQQPINQNVMAGTNVTFTVGALGSSPLTYQWQGNSGPLPNNAHFSGVNSNVLTISNVTLQDNGAYSAVVTNAFGTITSSNATLTVTAADTNSPVLHVFFPTPGLRVTNSLSLFTAVGTASDNVAVAAVFCQLNGGAWTNATGTNNWTAAVTLTAGTNIFSAYAADTSGNLSATSTVSFVFVQQTILTVLTNGHGTFTPKRNGQSLQTGNAYSITAKAAIGFKFAGWTSNLEGFLTNATTLTFVMEPNLVLTANFADVTRPTLTITEPKAGMHLSNALFNATGTAKDNVAVASVLYQLNNNGSWTSAVGTSNWTASLILVPGTNVLSVYAVDTSTNHSSTNTHKFFYVLSAPLTIQIAGGRGIITPNYNGKLLAISNSYTMTAAAAPGFAFQYWSGEVPMTSTARLKFTMQSNLVIVANFKDIARPVNVITNPAVGQTVTNTPFTASGKAKDNVGVSNVWVQLNGAGWNPANSFNSYTNWTATNLVLIAGANLIQAYAVDGVDNVSRTNSVKFKYKVTPVSDWAPDSLNGLLVQVQPYGNSNEIAGFDISTFAQTGLTGDTNTEDYGVGTYGYVKTGTNTAQLTLTNTAAPEQTNNSPGTIGLVFTNHYSGIFTNDSGDNGTLSAAVSGSFVPATLGGRMLVATKAGSGNVTTLVLGAKGKFTKTPANGGGAGASTGTYVFTRYSPVAGMLVLTFTDAADAGQTVYVQVTFKSAAGGTYFTSSFDNTGTLTETQVGTFVLK